MADDTATVKVTAPVVDDGKPDMSTEAITERTKADSEAKAKETPEPKMYTATKDVYVGSTYYKAGEPFVTTDDAADFWTEIDHETGQTMKAALEKVPGDAPLDGLSVDALQAVAVTKNINVTGMDKDQLITAIKAANEPAL